MVGVRFTAKQLNYRIDDDYTWVPFIGLIGNFYLMASMLGNTKYGVFKALGNKMGNAGVKRLTEQTSKEQFYGVSYVTLKDYTDKFLKVLDRLQINYNTVYVDDDKKSEYYNICNLFVMIENGRVSNDVGRWFTDEAEMREFFNISRERIVPVESIEQGLKKIFGLLYHKKLPNQVVSILFNMIDTLYTVYGTTSRVYIGADVEKSMVQATYEYYKTIKKLMDAEELIKQKEIADTIEFHKEIALPRIEKVQALLQDIQKDCDEQLVKHNIKV
jgi:hypothetical protein